MKRHVIAVLLLFAALAHAEDSALVKAAKATGGPKKKSTKKVITNSDVKKSAGKLTVLPASKTKAVPEAASNPAKGPVARHEEQRRASETAAKRVTAAEATVTALQKELARIEQSYYEANDPNYRDTTVKQRFDQTKRQLDDARKDLADARDAQKKATMKPSS